MRPKRLASSEAEEIGRQAAIRVVVVAVFRHGWAWGTLVAVLGMPLGDVALRRLRVRAALVNAGHLATGSAIVGWAYERAMGGALDMAAFAPANAGALLF